MTQEAAARNLKANKEDTNTKLTRVKEIKVVTEKNELEDKSGGIVVEHNHKKGEKEIGEDDTDWDILEENEIHDFEMVEVGFES